ncbi:hypothetical protein FC99_GL001274 [Levilactobacillus koreensis JCM 16448]|nr:hypothetical protein FC99_GL001274 [Levilactobacillus koreensis JCM 16448]
MTTGKKLSKPEAARDGASRGNGVGWRSLLAYTMGDFEDTRFWRGFKTSEKTGDFPG